MPLSDADSARALDAWLQEHLGSADRRAAVRAVADRLEDLQGCEYDELDEALELSTWPRSRVSSRLAPLEGGRGAVLGEGNDTDDDFDELYSEVAGAPASVTPDPPRAAPTRVAAPPPLPLSPASSASAPSTADSASDDDAWEAGARELLDEVRDARERDSRVGLEGLRSTLTRHGFGMAPPPHVAIGRPCRRPGDLPGGEPQDPLAAGPGPLPPARARRRRQGASQGDRQPAASEYATTGDAELARRLAMGLPPRRASRGPRRAAGARRRRPATTRTMISTSCIPRSRRRRRPPPPPTRAATTTTCPSASGRPRPPRRGPSATRSRRSSA